MTTPTPRTDDIQQTIDGLKSWADEERGAGNDSASESLECAAKLMEELQRDLAAALERCAKLEKREQWAANLLDIAKRDAKLPATLLQGIAQFQDERRADFPKEEPR